MARGSNTLTDSILNWFRGTSYPAATGSVWIALLDASAEITGKSGYSRQEVTKASGSWAAPSGAGTRLIDNAAAITFGPAGESWGTITRVAIMDASTSGNTLYLGDLTTPKTIGSGDSAQFAIGALDVTET